jgi:hypothetical protein
LNFRLFPEKPLLPQPKLPLTHYNQPVSSLQPFLLFPNLLFRPALLQFSFRADLNAAAQFSDSQRDYTSRSRIKKRMHTSSFLFVAPNSCGKPSLFPSPNHQKRKKCFFS